MLFAFFTLCLNVNSAFRTTKIMPVVCISQRGRLTSHTRVTRSSIGRSFWLAT